LGRPKIKIDESEVEKLAMMQCTNEEIAHWFNVSKDTIEERFSATIKRCRSKGVMSMKRQLFEKVQKGDLGAIVWWSKNFAGMSEKIEQKSTVTQTTSFKIGWADEPDQLNAPEKDVTSTQDSITTDKI
jgi:hypothetical protein